MQWEEVGPLLIKGLSGEKDDEKTEIGVLAQGLSKAADILSNKYSLVITNVPYLTRGKHTDSLLRYIDKNYYHQRKDLAAVFVERIQKFILFGTSCLVIPQNTLQLTGYTNFRKQLLLNRTFNIIAKLGPRAFETISGENVSVALTIISSRAPQSSSKILCFEASDVNTIEEKIRRLKLGEAVSINQAKQMENPDSRIIISLGDRNGTLLSEYADGVHGLGTKDAPRFIFYFWEHPDRKGDWEFLQASINSLGDWAGMESVIYWQRGNGELQKRARVGQAILAGSMVYGKKGVLVSPVGTMRSSMYHGELFDKSTAVICPKQEQNFAPIYCFIQSDDFKASIKQIDSKIAVTNKTLVKVPFDLEHWIKVSREKYPEGLPKPYSNDPTQWIFHGHPAKSDEPLQVVVARLLGYQWPAELDETMELSNQAHVWVNKSKALLSYADEDGIVCIPSVRGELKAEDRVENLLAAAYGSEWTLNKRSEDPCQSEPFREIIRVLASGKIFHSAL